MSPRPNRKSEKGAALIVVLLLVATLSFILLAVTNEVTASAQRSAADRARIGSYWQAGAGELIAAQVLKKFLDASPTRMTPLEGIFAKPMELEIEGGKATLAFRDATRCFNVNALVTGQEGKYDAENGPNEQSFLRLVQFIGLGPGEAGKIADVIADYIDNDSLTEPQGAEDGFYTALPTPFRTGGQLVKSISELRALDGISRRRYQRIRPYLCALGDTSLTAVNGNMLREEDARFVAALFPEGAGVSASDVAAAIGQLPPGGVNTVDEFPAPLKTAPGIAVVSNRIEALVKLEVNGLTIEERLLFETGGSAAVRLVARSFGEDF